jgi:signal transduction histidine kinase
MMSVDDDVRGDEVSRRGERLSVAMREIETFSLAVAHDFRIPLNAIYGAVQRMADRRDALDPELDDELREIHRDVALMQELMHRLLDLGRLVVAPLELEWIDMEVLAWEAWMAVPKRQGVQLVIAKLPKVRGNREMLKIVWLNLMCNAVAYSAGTCSPRIEITGGATEDAAVYGIRDTGRGFDLDYAGKLFYVFEKIQEQSEHPGTGVGLAIVQRIVTRHRGNVWIEGRRGEGTFVQFSLPLAKAGP